MNGVDCGEGSVAPKRVPPPQRFLSMLTRQQLAEMLAPTYAELRNVDVNEAYSRLEPALRSLKLIEGLQRETWRAVAEKKEKLDDGQLLDAINKRLGRTKRFQAMKPKRGDDGPLAALVVMVDAGAGIASGEAYGLLDTKEGELLLEKSFKILGAHLAKELLR